MVVLPHLHFPSIFQYSCEDPRSLKIANVKQLYIARSEKWGSFKTNNKAMSYHLDNRQIQSLYTLSIRNSTIVESKSSVNICLEQTTQYGSKNVAARQCLGQITVPLTQLMIECLLVNNIL